MPRRSTVPADGTRRGRRTRRRRTLAAALAGAALLGACESAPLEVGPVAAPPALAAAADSAAVLVGAGDIARCDGTGDEATARILDTIPGTVFTLGDNAYKTGTLAEYTDCYGPSWGRHRDRTRPAPGDRDYKTPGGAGYFDYFGAAAGDRTRGYYSYDVGDWHVVVLNSALPTDAGSAQVQWLRADLAASTRECTLAYWHLPLFYSGGTGVRADLRPLWEALYGAGAEVVVNADFRVYERFAPQAPDGTADPALGVRQFIVGTGGTGSTSFGTVRPNSEVRNTGMRGVLRLRLAAGGYSWTFIPVKATGFTDAGTGTCHGRPRPTAVPGGPYSSGAAVQFDGSASRDPGGYTPLAYAWDFGDGATGTGATPTHTYAAEGTYTVTLVVTNTLGESSAPAATTATVTAPGADTPPEVEAGPDRQAVVGTPLALGFTFTDDAADGPWAYTVHWGDGSTSTGTAAATGPVEASHAYAAAGGYVARVTVADAGGRSGADSAAVQVSGSGAGSVVLVGAGDVGSCTSTLDDATGRLLDTIPGTVFVAGDIVNPKGVAAEYASCYEPSWGRHAARTYAALGDNDYETGTAAAAFDYFGDRVGPRGKGYYSFDLGDWHVVVINDNSSYVSFSSGSEQDRWLVADLAANTRRCTLAIFHQPRFWDDRAGKPRKILWDRLYAAGVEVILNGHRHYYQRWAPQTPDGQVDPARGIRQFIVGTGGGGNLTSPHVVVPNSEVWSRSAGVLKLTLHPDRYEWKFVPADGYTFTDSGSTACH
jgi:PKD repeat protein